MLVLENSAGGGFGLGTNVTELAEIAEAVAASGIAAERIGFCLDTAHAWAAGVDLCRPDATDAFLAEFDARIGIERLVMIHLNDSKSALGSRLDRHEHLGAGRIGATGLAHLLNHPMLGHVAYFLETPGMDEGYDAVNVARARDLAAGRALAALPPEALTVRGSRSRTGPSQGPEE
jgi:deoxyribonuclease-4